MFSSLTLTKKVFFTQIRHLKINKNSDTFVCQHYHYPLPSPSHSPVYISTILCIHFKKKNNFFLNFHDFVFFLIILNKSEAAQKKNQKLSWTKETLFHTIKKNYAEILGNRNIIVIIILCLFWYEHLLNINDTILRKCRINWIMTNLSHTQTNHLAHSWDRNHGTCIFIVTNMSKNCEEKKEREKKNIHTHTKTHSKQQLQQQNWQNFIDLIRSDKFTSDAKIVIFRS